MKALEARRDGLDLKTVIDKNVKKIPEEMLVTDIFEVIKDAEAPLAVVDESDKLKGVVIRGSVIEALSQSDRNEEGTHID